MFTADPRRIVLCRDGDVAVSELIAHVPELDTGAQQLRRERVTEILEPPVTDPGSLADAPPLATTEHLDDQPRQNEALGAGLPRTFVKRCQRIAKAK